ncbi:uncharacterized protein Dwil_GK23051 [Drosophila willistoni]|uniref:Protein TsetseEP domain-containing protein n=1 Tax=Drosophila willistoni TaxID=7260 RepID=B4NMQ0_DROWI|nr:uncharacterized protein LOC6652360 [Drosophila willistoni]EDW85639.1 uncharacterized protein Dwil_GK23051 [Drosophila willistoni]
MFQLRGLLFQCCLALGMLVLCHQSWADQRVEKEPTTTCKPTTTTTCKPGATTADPGKGGGKDLCEDFQNLRATIDRATLVTIIQTHYECDSKFRRAMSYYNTTRFHEVAQMLQQSTAYRSLLQELQDDGVDTSDLENIVDIIACIILPVAKADNDCDCRAVRGHSFMSDILLAMPKQKVHDYLSLARSEKSNFALLANTLTSPEFQERLRANMVKRDMVRPLRILRRNGWDIPELLRGVLTILSW